MIPVLRRVEYNSITVNFPAVTGQFLGENVKIIHFWRPRRAPSVNTQAANKPHGLVSRFCDPYFRGLRFNLGPGFG